MGAWFDQASMKDKLVQFFDGHRPNVTTFGNTVNQTFEAFVFAALVAWYRKDGWDVKFVHPRGKSSSSRLLLKYNTMGRPGNYSYAVCTKGRMTVQIHHQLRVATRHHREPCAYPANVCLDVAVIDLTDVTKIHTNQAIPNRKLVTFGEAKHFHAYAELIAGFIGLVHELRPTHVRTKRKPHTKTSPHLYPFLYVSGNLGGTALGIVGTMKRRNLPIQVYCNTRELTSAFKLHEGDFSPAELLAHLKAKEKARNAAAKQRKKEEEAKLKDVPY